MARVVANRIEIEYESFGSAKAPAILLIMGLGAQLIRWNMELCDLLVARGYRVIRFDNRDCGLSTHCDQFPRPDLRLLQPGKPLPSLSYSLDDMAADSLGLLDALGIAQAHIVGASLGGAIAQLIAARHPERTLSLTSIMSSSGNPALPLPTPAANLALFAPLPLQRDKESIVADACRRFAALCSPAYPTEPERLRRLFSAEYDRAFHPAGVVRQLAAQITNGDRRPLLGRITAPTVVLHGADDPLIRVECGRDVAAHVPGAELRIIPGMAHDFAPGLSATFADAICAAASRA